MPVKKLKKAVSDRRTQTPVKALKPAKKLRTTLAVDQAGTDDLRGDNGVKDDGLTDGVLADTLSDKARTWFQNVAHRKMPLFNIADVYPVAFVCLICGKKVRADGGLANVDAKELITTHATNRHDSGVRIARELVYYSAAVEMDFEFPFRYQCLSCGTAHASIRGIVVHACAYVEDVL